jgi:hypothetical protein
VVLDRKMMSAKDADLCEALYHTERVEGLDMKASNFLGARLGV